MIGLGIWNAGSKITDLVYAVNTVQKNDGKQDQVNERQDQQIKTLEVTLAKQQGYLERILDAVQDNGKRIGR
jgi:septal ring factor EnvC (AmiA/AmiB activator)